MRQLGGDAWRKRWAAAALFSTLAFTATAQEPDAPPMQPTPSRAEGEGPFDRLVIRGAWRSFYRVWMGLLNDYKNMGGRVTVSSDAGFIYNLYGFSTIEEMELLQEAGFHPLEILRGPRCTRPRPCSSRGAGRSSSALCDPGCWPTS